MTLGNPYGAMARCIMNPDKTVDYFLDVNDSNKKMDGTTVDWALVESSGQNVMVQIPKFYMCKKFVEETQSMFFGVVVTPKETTYIAEKEWVVHPAFFKDQVKAFDDPTSVAVEVPFRYIGAFFGSLDAKGKLRSLPYRTSYATSAGTLRGAAKATGAGYCCFDFNLMCAIQMLFITEYENPDSRSVLGENDYWRNDLVGGCLPSGRTLVFGNKSTSPSSGVGIISYRGIESIQSAGFGCLIDGLINDGTNIKLGSEVLCKNVTGSGTTRTIDAGANTGFLPKTIIAASRTAGLHNVITNNGSQLFSTYGGPWTTPGDIFSLQAVNYDASLSTRLAL